MKKIKLVLMFVVLSSIITTMGCSKEKDTPQPTPTPVAPAPVSYSKFNLAKITVTSMSFYNSSGYTWDTSSDPDIYFLMSNSAGTLLVDGSTIYQSNIAPANLPISWTSTTPYVINPITEGFYIHLYDNDVNDFPSNSDDYIGSVWFNMSNYTSTYSTTVYSNNGTIYITINGTWSN